MGLLLGVGATLMTGFFEPLFVTVSVTYRQGSWHLLETVGLLGIVVLFGGMTAAAFYSSLYFFWIPIEEPIRAVSRRLHDRWRRPGTVREA